MKRLATAVYLFSYFRVVYLRALVQACILIDVVYLGHLETEERVTLRGRFWDWKMDGIVSGSCLMTSISDSPLTVLVEVS